MGIDRRPGSLGKNEENRGDWIDFRVEGRGKRLVRGLLASWSFAKQELSMAPRALVIEDDKVNLLLVSRTLEKRGWQVDSATNGRSAMTLMGERNYDLVVTDIIMPDQEGLETISRIRRDHPSLRILAMSAGGAKPDFDYLKIARTLGACDTIRKPFTPSALLVHVDRVMALPAPRPISAADGGMLAQ
jgi:two-component system, chemotaxis family, chemotaxis protein CheY